MKRLVLAAAVLACSPKEPNAFHDRVATIGRSVADIPAVTEPCRVAQAMCAPFGMRQSRDLKRASMATKGEHARKIYSVRASDPTQLRSDDAPIGLVVVKEAWQPIAIPEPAAISPSIFRGSCDSPPYVMIDREQYRAGDPAGLYVMEKLDPKTPGTDAGWIYGVVSPQGTVLSAGNVESCAGCHATARHDRLFSPEE